MENTNFKKAEERYCKKEESFDKLIERENKNSAQIHIIYKCPYILYQYKYCAVKEIFFQSEKNIVKQRTKLSTREKSIDHIGRRNKQHLDV